MSPCTLRLVVPANPLTGKIRPRRIDASPRHEPAFFVEAVNRPDFADSEPAENDDTLATACEQASEGTLGVKLPQKHLSTWRRRFVLPRCDLAVSLAKVWLGFGSWLARIYWR